MLVNNPMKLLQKCKIFYIYDGLLKFGLSCACPLCVGNSFFRPVIMPNTIPSQITRNRIVILIDKEQAHSTTSMKSDILNHRQNITENEHGMT